MWIFLFLLLVVLVSNFTIDKKIDDWAREQRKPDCDWCKRGWEVCGTCEKFFDRDNKCSKDSGEYGFACYKPFGYCPKCGRKLKEDA